MHRKQFFTQLVILSIATILLLLAIHSLSLFQPYTMLSWTGIIFFIFWSSILYLIGELTAKSKDRNAFNRFIISAMMGKMLFIVLIVAVYHEIVKPESKFFLIPFFVVYIFYTIFEVYFMTILGKEEKIGKQK